jgi:hypothetical protein
VKEIDGKALAAKDDAIVNHAATEPGSQRLVADAFSARGPAPPPGTQPLQSMAQPMDGIHRITTMALVVVMGCA